MEAEPDGPGEPPPLGGVHAGQGSHAGAHPHPRIALVDRARRRQEKARLNCITHLLDQVPYLPVDHTEVQLPERVHHQDYLRHPVPEHMFVPDRY